MLAFACAQSFSRVFHFLTRAPGGSPDYQVLTWNVAVALLALPSLPLLGSVLDAMPPAGPSRYAWLVAAPLAIAACLGAGLVATGHSIDVVPAYALTIAVALAATAYRSVARSARAEMLGHEARATEMNAALTRARLRLLQSQLEPHFLFNTLATVQALGRRERAAAVAVLDDLAGYLAEALPTFVQPDCTLADELRLVEAYLRIQGTRMGERLQISVEVPPAVRTARVPTLLVYALVDNAIRHGIAPAVSGGRLTITASRERSTLDLQIADSGRGMKLTEGRSFGLANARHRLALLYGERALLTLSTGMSNGLIVTVAMPFRERSPDQVAESTESPVINASGAATQHANLAAAGAGEGAHFFGPTTATPN